MDTLTDRLNTWNPPEPSIEYRHEDNRILIYDRILIGILYWRKRIPTICFIHRSSSQPGIRAHIRRIISASFDSEDLSDTTGADLRY